MEYRQRRNGHRQGARLVAAIVVSVACSAVLPQGTVSACSVPVYRYALERWHPDPFTLCLFTRGAPTAAESLLMAQASLLSSAPMMANLRPVLYNLADTVDTAGRALFRALADTSLPQLALYPQHMRSGTRLIWNAPLSAASLMQVADSPIRREIVRRIGSGETCVWLILTGKNRAAARAVVDTLRRTLPELEKSLELPVPDPSSGHFPPSPGVPLKIAFSTLVVSATDPGEQVLVKLLLNNAALADTLTEPIVYPMFGRGRALVDVPGSKVTEATVREIARFLTGPCACTVKEQNPGSDLVFAADWHGMLKRVAEPELPVEEVAELTGLSELAGKAARELAPSKSAGSPVPATTDAVSHAPDSTGAPHCSLDVVRDTAATSAPIQFSFQSDSLPATPRTGGMMRGLVGVLAGLVVLVAVSSVLILRRRRGA